MVWWGTYGLNGWGSYDSKLLYAGYRLGGGGGSLASIYYD